MHKTENYLGYILKGNPDTDKKNNDTKYSVNVMPDETKNNNDFIFIEETVITGNTEPGLINELAEITFSKAKARIMLNFFDKGKEYDQTITTETIGLQIKPMGDDMIYKWILKGLINIRKRFPLNYKEQYINHKGLCSILGIDENQYLFNASILQEDGFIETQNTDEYNLRNGGIYITSYGVNELNFISGPKTPLSDDTKFKIQSKLYGKKDLGDPKYNMTISFAGEDKSIAEELSVKLKGRSISVFLDSYEKEMDWDIDFYDYLNYIYSESARFCILLISVNYANKIWIDHEKRIVQARAFRENSDYILPVRIDDSQMPGLPETIGYIKYNNNTDNIVELAIRKLNESY